MHNQGKSIYTLAIAHVESITSQSHSAIAEICSEAYSQQVFKEKLIKVSFFFVSSIQKNELQQTEIPVTIL